MKLLVNILNKGALWGLKTPAYNVEMDESLYKFLKEMGMMIEIAKPTASQPVIMKAIPVEQKPEPTVKDPILEETPIVQETPITKKPTRSMKPAEVIPEWLKKDVYTEADLKHMTKDDMLNILAYRGHVCARSGKRDKFAPKFTDGRQEMIDKVLATNKNN